MPPIGILRGGVDFENIFLTLKEGASVPRPDETLGAAREAGAVTINVWMRRTG